MASNVEDRAHWHLIKDGPKRPADQVSMAEREAAALAKVTEGSHEIVRTEGNEPNHKKEEQQ